MLLKPISKFVPHSLTSPEEPRDKATNGLQISKDVLLKYFVLCLSLSYYFDGLNKMIL